MATLYITCPTTGKDMPTMLNMDEYSFTHSNIVGPMTEPCKHCNQRHTYGKAELFFKQEK